MPSTKIIYLAMHKCEISKIYILSVSRNAKKRKNPSPNHYPRGSRLLACRLFPSMIPKQRRRILCVLFQAASRCTTHCVTRYTVCAYICMCVYTGCCSLLVIQASWRIIRISHARTHADTHEGTHDLSVAAVTSLSLSFPFFLSSSLSFSRESTASTRIFGSAGRDGWARPSFGQGAVLQGFPRDLPRARLMRYGRWSQRNPCIGNDGLASPPPPLLVVFF